MTAAPRNGIVPAMCWAMDDEGLTWRDRLDADELEVLDELDPYAIVVRDGRVLFLIEQ